MDVDVLFEDATESSSPAEQVLSRLETEEMTVYLLTCREGAALQLTVCAGSEVFGGRVGKKELSSMAQAVGMAVEEFTKETERALTRQQLGAVNYVYSLKRSFGCVELVWKRHLVSDNVKVCTSGQHHCLSVSLVFSLPPSPLQCNLSHSFLQFQLGSVTLEPKAPGASYQLILEHAVSTTQSLQQKIEDLEREKSRLASERQVALSLLDKCANLKEELEGELYGKFKIVLNEKKAKIRRLMEQLETLSDQNKSLQLQVSSHVGGGIPSSSAADEGDAHRRESRETDDEMAGDTPSPKQPSSPPPMASSSLLGEGQEVVSPPVKRRRRQTRKKGGGEPEIPRPPTITRPPSTDKVKVRPERGDSGASVESDDLLQQL